MKLKSSGKLRRSLATTRGAIGDGRFTGIRTGAISGKITGDFWGIILSQGAGGPRKIPPRGAGGKAGRKKIGGK